MPSEIDRLEELLDAQEAAFRRAFLRYVQLVGSAAVIGIVTEMLERNEAAAAMDLLESYIEQMADVLPRIQQRVGEATVAGVGVEFPAVIAAISFDSSNPLAAEAVRTQRLALIQQFSRSQFESVEQAIRRGVGSGRGAQETARAFRDAIGLTASQEAAVANYRRLLETGSREALERALRDRRFDDRVRTALERNRPLTTRQIDTMVRRYRARAIMARAETISRSEAGRAFAEAREEALRQMLERAGIDPSRVVRRWNATRDQRVRDYHLSMQAQERPLGIAFEDGRGNQLRYPHDPEAPAETTINCRCTLTFRVRPPV